MLKKTNWHLRCRNGIYPFSQVQRFPVKDGEFEWRTPLPDYQPAHYESPNLRNKPWADPKLDFTLFKPKWNQVDGLTDRRSHHDEYRIVNQAPQNPVGRTGIIGRGVLGKWGPNHAADPVVTRWKRDHNAKVLHPESKLPILQFCAIQRHDNNEWAIPGGMVDPNETINKTLLREFMEEAMNSMEQCQKNVEDTEQMLEAFFKDGVKIYEGYVDDPRNTDNAWMETVAVNFHDDTGDFVGKFSLTAGDDAKAVKWLDISGNLALYASHKNFIQHVAKIRNAHF